MCVGFNGEVQKKGTSDEEMRSLRLRENSVTLGWTVEIDEEREREGERIEERKQTELNEKKKNV